MQPDWVLEIPPACTITANSFASRNVAHKSDKSHNVAPKSDTSLPKMLAFPGTSSGYVPFHPESVARSVHSDTTQSDTSMLSLSASQDCIYDSNRNLNIPPMRPASDSNLSMNSEETSWVILPSVDSMEFESVEKYVPLEAPRREKGIPKMLSGLFGFLGFSGKRRNRGRVIEHPTISHTSGNQTNWSPIRRQVAESRHNIPTQLPLSDKSADTFYENIPLKSRQKYEPPFPPPGSIYSDIQDTSPPKTSLTPDPSGSRRRRELVEHSNAKRERNVNNIGSTPSVPTFNGKATDHENSGFGMAEKSNPLTGPSVRKATSTRPSPLPKPALFSSVEMIL